ncbi:MAG: hypothetical protein KAQ96_03305, partial [Thermoplasmata archaeon]|nr:hypothetical protein [Thermoplasmata archaeon]
MDLALYIGGVTYGSFPGFTNMGGSDLFIQSANVKGGPMRVTQFGTTTSDWMETICEDDDKMLYVGGHTQGAFPGFTNKGRADGFVQKINPRNSEPDPKLPPKFYQPIWTDQFGTAEYDGAYALHVDGNSVYVGGETSGTLPDQVSNGESDTFLRKYDHSGVPELTYQFGSEEWEWVSGICGNDEDVYIVGETAGTMTVIPGYGESDCFIGKFDPSPKIFTTESPVDLGDVNVWDTITVPITVWNLGLEYVIVDDMSLAETGSEYYTMGDVDAFVLWYGDTETVEVNYHPWESGIHATTVLITCEEPVGLMEVEITATAVASEAPPDEQVDDVIDFTDDEVSEG